MPTPLIYRDILYVLNNDGPLGCYDLQSGAEHYYLRVPHKGNGFSASPVGADGRIYFSSEDGLVFVIKAGTEFEILATNSIGEPLMASPAISGGTMFLRGSNHLFAIGQ
jgi:outer membrane protein assembly factor BamB